MKEIDFIDFIKTLGFRYTGTRSIDKLKRFKYGKCVVLICSNKKKYYFHNGDYYIGMLKFEDDIIFKEYFKTEFRFIKIKNILKR